MKDLLTYMRQLAKRINTHISHPNKGGCCVIAAEIAEHLEKIVPVRIRVSNAHFDYTDDDCNLSDMVEYLGEWADHDSWNDADVLFGHVFIEFDYKGRTYHMDSSGVNLAKNRDPSFGWLMYDGHLTIGAAKTLAGEATSWNRTFDRKQIPTVQKIVETVFYQLPLTPNPV